MISKIVSIILVLTLGEAFPGFGVETAVIADSIMIVLFILPVAFTFLPVGLIQLIIDKIIAHGVNSGL